MIPRPVGLGHGVSAQVQGGCCNCLVRETKVDASTGDGCGILGGIRFFIHFSAERVHIAAMRASTAIYRPRGRFHLSSTQPWRGPRARARVLAPFLWTHPTHPVYSTLALPRVRKASSLGVTGPTCQSVGRTVCWNFRVSFSNQTYSDEA